MDNYIYVIGLLIVNLIGIAFSFGKLWQKTNDLSHRLKRLERIQNGKDRDVRHTAP